jgi:ring-1,2-phenylacetyl-CoA epoxidase subunit PaaC
LIKEKVSVDLSGIKNLWLAKVKEVFSEAGLTIPEDVYMQTGSRKAQHTEHLGFLLAEMQHLHRAFPGAQW